MDTRDKKRFATRTVAGSFSSDRRQPSASRQGRGLYFESSHAFEGAMTFNFSTPGELGSVLNLSCTLKLFKETILGLQCCMSGQATPESEHFQSMQPCRRDQTFLRARSQCAIPNATLVNASPLETNQWSSVS